MARSHPQLATSHPHLARSHPPVTAASIIIEYVNMLTENDRRMYILYVLRYYGFPRRCEILLLTFSPPNMIPPPFLSMTSSDLEIGSLTAWGLESGSWLGLANLLLSAGFFPDLRTGRKKVSARKLIGNNYCKW